MPPIPGLSRLGAVVYGFNHFLIVGFGTYQNSALGIFDSTLSDMYGFDFITRTWFPLMYSGTILPSTGGEYFQYGNKCYLRGGADSNQIYNSNMYEFDATPLIEMYSGVQEPASDIERLRVYPIPVRDILHIDGDIQAMDISVTDIVGRRCTAPLSGRDIDVSALPAGVYVLHVSDRGATIVRRFLKE